MLKTGRAWTTSAERLVITFVWALALLLLIPAAARAENTVLVLGDSLSAAYGLASGEGWVHLLDERLQARHPGWRVVNASISGETTAGGASRIDGELATHAPQVVVIELGANDGLRGLPLEAARANLTRMVEASQAADARVLVIGMHIPPNYGPEYTQAFHALFGEIAKAHDTAVLPFLLEPIATDREAFLPDNLHPNAQAQPKLLEHVWPALQPMLAAEK
jgi:acyl-CoA thioesterase-1